MKTDFEIEIRESKTPTDRRTWQRKQLEKRVKEIIPCKYYSHFGFFAWLRFKDIDLLTDCLNNKN